MQIGRVIKKIQRHPRYFVIAPPIIGPAAKAIPRLAPQNAKALLRATPVKSCAITAKEDVSNIAPPTPWLARARLSVRDVGAIPQITEAAAKITSPMIIARR